MPLFIDEYESILSNGKHVNVLRTFLASPGNHSEQTSVSRQCLLIKMDKTDSTTRIRKPYICFPLL